MLQLIAASSRERDIQTVTLARALCDIGRRSRILRDAAHTGSRKSGQSSFRCPLWVISGHSSHPKPCPLCPQKRTLISANSMSALGHNRTHALQQTSGRAFPAVSFVYLSVECPFNKFYGINCRPKLGAKLLDRFFHRRRQVSPPVNNLTHRFFDGSQHFLYCNFTVGFRHSAIACSSSR